MPLLPDPHDDGGSGVALNEERQLAGYGIDVLVGPPYPDPMPFARSVTRLTNQQYWAGWFSRDRRALFPRGAPLRVFQPLEFWELSASRMGFLPEPFA